MVIADCPYVADVDSTSLNDYQNLDGGFYFYDWFIFLFKSIATLADTLLKIEQVSKLIDKKIKK